MATLTLDTSLFRNAERVRSAAYVRGIFDREMGVTLHNARVGSPGDDAMRELTKTTTNLYAKRVLRELIQNAFDGASRTGAARILVRLDLREGPHGIHYVVNTGEGFTESNVDAISNPALSDKRPGNFIGHKGLEFRSAELLSDDTQIFSMADIGRTSAIGFDGFCFRFAAAADERAWLAARRGCRSRSSKIRRKSQPSRARRFRHIGPTATARRACHCACSRGDAAAHRRESAHYTLSRSAILPHPRNHRPRHLGRA
jgi:hypothetical protein